MGRPKQEVWPECRIEGCERTTRGSSKGFCTTHYKAARNGIYDMETGQQIRERKRVQSYGPGALCSFEGCLAKARARGLCSKHFQAAPPPPVLHKNEPYDEAVTCLVQDCARRPASRGMCDKHTQQRRAGILDEAGEKLRELLPRGRTGPGFFITKQGYKYVRQVGHPHATQDGYVLEHRLVMECLIGRFLERHEIVHHKDGNRLNNDPGNLELMTQKEHPPAHALTKDSLADGLRALRANDPAGFAALLQEVSP